MLAGSREGVKWPSEGIHPCWSLSANQVESAPSLLLGGGSGIRLGESGLIVLGGALSLGVAKGSLKLEISVSICEQQMAILGDDDAKAEKSLTSSPS